MISILFYLKVKGIKTISLLLKIIDETLLNKKHSERNWSWKNAYWIKTELAE